MRDKWEIEIDRYIAIKNWLLYGVVLIISALFWLATYTLIFYFSFWTIRMSFNGTYHASDFYECRYWTRLLVITGTLCVAALTCVFSLGAASPIIISYIAAYSLHKVWLKTKKAFDLDNCTAEQLHERCKKVWGKRGSEKRITRAIDHFINKTEHKFIDPINPEASKKERQRWRRKLE